MKVQYFSNLSFLIHQDDSKKTSIYMSGFAVMIYICTSEEMKKMNQLKNTTEFKQLYVIL